MKKAGHTCGFEPTWVLQEGETFFFKEIGERKKTRREEEIKQQQREEMRESERESARRQWGEQPAVRKLVNLAVHSSGG